MLFQKHLTHTHTRSIHLVLVIVSVACRPVQACINLKFPKITNSTLIRLLKYITRPSSYKERFLFPPRLTLARGSSHFRWPATTVRSIAIFYTLFSHTFFHFCNFLPRTPSVLVRRILSIAPSLSPSYYSRQFLDGPTSSD